MPVKVFAIVLFAALLHAGWNAIVKGGCDKVMMTILVTSLAALFSLAALSLLPQPAMPSWPYVIASVLVHIVYFVLVARAYHAGDMGQAYPLMRGTAPLLVAMAGSLFLGEHLSAGATAGILLICLGILGMTLAGRREHRHAMAYASANAVVIATYTLIDGFGVRRSGSPAAYTLWVFFLTGLPLVLWVMLRRRRLFLTYARAHWPSGAAGGAGTVISYGLVLWAMTAAAIPVVAALRETGILFGMALSAVFLKERAGPIRTAAACIIAAGAIALRLA